MTRESRGTVTLGEEVRISDPCYDPDTWCAGTLENVKSGLYNCYVNFQDTGKFGIRVASIIAVHSEFDNEDFKNPAIVTNIDVGVDSGQCGIYDLEYFKRNQPDGEWYDRVYYQASHKNDKFDAGTIDGKCFVSASGFGDGSYNCFVKYNDNGQIVFIEIRYLEEEFDREEDSNG